MPNEPIGTMRTHKDFEHDAKGNRPDQGVRAVKNVLLRCRAAGFTKTRCCDFAEISSTMLDYWLQHDEDFRTHWENSVNYLINMATLKMSELVFTGHNSTEIFEEDGEIKLIRRKNTDPSVKDLDVFINRLERNLGTDKQEDLTDKVLDALQGVAKAFVENGTPMKQIGHEIEPKEEDVVTADNSEPNAS